MGVIGEKVKNRIDDLEKRVAKNQREIILVFRRIYTGTEITGDFIPPRDHHQSYFEAGVIDGDLEKSEKRDKSCFVDLPLIDVHSYSAYLYFPNIFVPVDRKLFINPLLVSPIGLSKAKKGQIGVDSLEFLPRVDTPGYNRNLPCLEDFEVFIGDKEITRFMLSDRFEIYRNDLKKRVSDFLHLMKNSKEIEKKAGKEYFNMREKLAVDLVREVSDLSKTYEEILGIEERVLKLHLERIHSGMEDMSSSVEWNESSTLKLYITLKARASESFEKIDKLLKEADEIDFAKHPSVSGKKRGFPAEIKPQNYLNYINRNLLPSFKSIFKKLDKHLEETKKIKV